MSALGTEAVGLCDLTDRPRVDGVGNEQTRCDAWATAPLSPLRLVERTRAEKPNGVGIAPADRRREVASILVRGVVGTRKGGVPGHSEPGGNSRRPRARRRAAL